MPLWTLAVEYDLFAIARAIADALINLSRSPESFVSQALFALFSKELGQ